jgi:maltooligosyltrehalose trehalohydrolase
MRRVDPIHLPQGAFRQPDGSVLWRVWAPQSDRVTLVLHRSSGRADIVMQSAEFGYFVHQEEEVDERLGYVYRLSDGKEYPDPASRWQPDGVHQPSAVFSPGAYAWSDQDWRGIAREDLSIYELHVGTFTPEGTFDAIIPRLAALRELGIAVIELMPVSQFPGDRNWGYDGVHPFAVQASYGGPRGLQRLVDRVHRERLGVFLDVVHNHLGPEGNYLARYGPYFTDKHRTPWGPAVNFDDAECDAVRQYFVDNARMWVRDFHADGLRLDAVETIFDLSPRHILAEIKSAVQGEAMQQNRSVHVIAESDQNDTRLVSDPDQGGCGLDGVWSDDFHHCIHSVLTHEGQGYYQDFGSLCHLVKAYNEVFVRDGCYSAFSRRRHGSPAGGTDRTRFVACVQNHDQVGNRPLGDRFGTLLAPEAQRLACALLLLSPFTPLIFMGEEYGETRPFPFFCSFGEAGLIEAVRRARREGFTPLASERQSTIPDPQAPETFRKAKLSWQWPEGTVHAGIRRLYMELFACRRRWPGLLNRQNTAARLIHSGTDSRESLLILERGGETGLVAIANVGGELQFVKNFDRDGRDLLLSSEECRFGGRRLSCDPFEPLLPYELQVFGNSEWRP